MLGLKGRFRQGGFSLVELMVTLVVAAILLSVAVPSFNQIIAGNRAASAANDLLASLQFARSEAVKQARIISMCPSTDGATCTGGVEWDSGWIVRTNSSSAVLRVANALHATVTVSGPLSVSFQPAGNVVLAPSASFFSLGVADTDPRSICLEVAGSSEVRKSENCS